MRRTTDLEEVVEQRDRLLKTLKAVRPAIANPGLLAVANDAIRLVEHNPIVDMADLRERDR